MWQAPAHHCNDSLLSLCPLTTKIAESEHHLIVPPCVQHSARAPQPESRCGSQRRPRGQSGAFSRLRRRDLTSVSRSRCPCAAKYCRAE
ncbi:hypothetical protein BDZ90DRAFT_164520 [Jaminaea rosea]|uniref:Uncharacterized protein n=1 Tax=Jaminaea rosea TaxID=1569628 RepID=A0A316USC5_9BASI|nr:hypothetical protein BDZ90DRAFT_164520 [Jaminaea rosea]PWN28182.1 hypothetical protein BDZ90DRAFT_164520 [Jaminaea rosea]